MRPTSRPAGVAGAGAAMKPSLTKAPPHVRKAAGY